MDKLLSVISLFSNCSILYAKGLLKNLTVFYITENLKKAALYSFDRKKLFKIIVKNKEEIKLSENNLENNNLKIGSPIIFQDKEMHSFSEWLSISKIKKISRSENDLLLDNFIKNEKNNKISKPKSFFNALDSQQKKA